MENYLTPEEVRQKYEEFQEHYANGIDMSTKLRDDMIAKALGEAVLKLMRQDDVLKAAIEAAESRAIKALQNIKEILDDDTLEDPTCFMRIETIVCELENIGSGTSRHDF